MEILERVIAEGLAIALLDDGELDQLRDELDQYDGDSLKRMVNDAIESERTERSARYEATVGWFQKRNRRQRPSPRG